MSMYIRAAILSSVGRRGRIMYFVPVSGTAIMSDSSMALKPVIEERQSPCALEGVVESSPLIESLELAEESVNQRRMKRMSRSSTKDLMSSAVLGCSAMGLLQRSVGGAPEAA